MQKTLSEMLPNRLSETLINNLMKLHPKGFDLSLGRITKLLERLGNPHLKLPPVIHIAGTNGKGSATAYCRALLESAGKSVHVHTSPHLVNWHERYRIGHKNGGQLVDDATFADAISRVAKANDNQPITVFEILTAVAFVLFSEQPADAVILEVGLGGRFDATNVIESPAATLIMPIALDHVAYLGDTVEKIAFEKGGIIKKNTPVIIGKQDNDAATDVLIEIAEKNRSPYVVFGQDYLSYDDHGRMVFQNENGLMDLPHPNLIGQHQIANAGAAIETVLQAGFTLREHEIAQALKHVAWPARMQHLAHGTLVDQLPKTLDIWLDGGHNPAAAGIITDILKQRQNIHAKPLILISGMINTKDNLGFYQAFKGLVDTVYCVPIVSSDAGIPADQLAAIATKAGLNAVATTGETGSVQEALNHIAETKPNATVLICGSLYLCGDVLAQNGTPPN